MIPSPAVASLSVVPVERFLADQDLEPEVAFGRVTLVRWRLAERTRRLRPADARTIATAVGISPDLLWPEHTWSHHGEMSMF